MQIPIQDEIAIVLNIHWEIHACKQQYFYELLYIYIPHLEI